MKTLTLSQAWQQSIKQWRWIVKQLDDGSLRDVEFLKRQWLDENGYKQVKYNCLLCEYAAQNNTSTFFCGDCPGVLVNCGLNKFWCQSYEYNYAQQPRAFLTKLEEANAMSKL